VAALNQIVVTFDEAVDPGTFDGADVVLKNASGLTVSPVTVTPVVGSGNMQFTLAFADQAVRGRYDLTVGPNLADASGNLMNQDGDALNGESADTYSGTVVYWGSSWTPASAPPVLYAEDFEWSSVPSRWEFRTASGATIQTVETGTPHGGGRHLRMQESGAYVAENATLLVDLSGQSGATDLWLDFWTQDLGYPGYSSIIVSLSNEGTTFWDVLSIRPGNSYVNPVLDLDAKASEKGITLDSDVYIRFTAKNDTKAALNNKLPNSYHLVFGKIL
jgi:hypothetical protein